MGKYDGHTPKPCPFCGSQDIKLESWEDWPDCGKPKTYWAIGCKTDGCYGEWDRELHYHRTAEDALGMWNRRADAPMLAAENAKLAEQNAKMLYFIKNTDCNRCMMNHTTCSKNPGSEGCKTKDLIAEVEGK